MTATAIVSTGLGHVRRGNETWARTVAEALHLSGESVRLFGGGVGAEIDCPYRRIPHLRRDWPAWRPFLSWGRRYAYEQRTFAAGFTRHLRRHPHDIVHTADPVLAYRLGLEADRLNYQLIYKDGLLLGPEWCRRFAWVQVLAPYYLDEAVGVGVNTDRWFVIPHLVDLERFRPPANRMTARLDLLGPEVSEKTLVVLAIGDFAPESNKRLDWIVSEVAALGKHADVHLLIAGQADPRHVERLEEASRPLHGRITIKPNTRPERMPALYQAADVFAHAGLREPFGIVFLEAMASGLPAVGHTFPVTQWIIGEGGTTVDMTHRGDLTQILDRWHREPTLREDLAAAARSRANESFCPTRIVPLYRQMYSAMRSVR